MLMLLKKIKIDDRVESGRAEFPSCSILTLRDSVGDVEFIPFSVSHSGFFCRPFFSFSRSSLTGREGLLGWGGDGEPRFQGYIRG